MIAVVQRVSQASVTSLSSSQTNAISQGLCLLLGVAKQDDLTDVTKLVDKITKLRIFANQDKKMDLDVKTIKGEILLISQFTLLANTKKGNRPSFINAASPEQAEKLYLSFADKLQQQGVSVKTGFFGHYMKIDLSLDGPVTINLDSKQI